MYGFPAGDALRGLEHAVLGWAVLLPFIMIGLTVAFKPILTLLQKRCGQHPAPSSLRDTQTGKGAVRRLQARKPEEPERKLTLSQQLHIPGACCAQYEGYLRTAHIP